MPSDLVSVLLSHGQDRDAAAIRSSSATLSYGDLDVQTRQIAAALQHLGCSAGDRVATILPKSLDSFLLFLGILRAGCVAVPIASEHPAPSIAGILRASAATLAIFEDGYAVPKAVRCACESYGPGNTGSLGAHISGADAQNHVPSDLAQDAGALILFTSGTTGDPKGVLHRVSGLLASAEALAQVWGLSQQDSVLHGLPISHAHGLIIATLPVFRAGGCLLWLDRFEPRAVLRRLPEATGFMGVPFHYQSLLDCADASADAFAGLRLCACGSAPLSDDLAARFKHVTGKDIAQRYAMTETITLTANAPQNVRPGTVGRALPGVSLRILDPETRQDPGTGRVGEVVVKSPTVFARYVNHSADSDFTADGFFRTGDMGALDKDGYLTLVGRRKDIIIYSGQNVYPGDVELHLERLEGVAEACVFGVPHPQTGEAVIAAIVAAPGVPVSATGLRRQLISQLAPYQVPKRILIIDQIPRNALGKPLRAKLAADHAP